MWISCVSVEVANGISYENYCFKKVNDYKRNSEMVAKFISITHGDKARRALGHIALAVGQDNKPPKQDTDAGNNAKGRGGDGKNALEALLIKRGSVHLGVERFGIDWMFLEEALGSRKKNFAKKRKNRKKKKESSLMG